VALLLLVAFSQVNRENWKQNTEAENLKQMHSGQERCELNVVNKKGLFAKDTIAKKERKKERTWNCHKRSLRASKKFTRPHIS
jgi:hypothetical protein